MNEKTPELTSKLPIQLTYCYLAISILIFLFGWLKLPLAIVITFFFIISLVKAIKNAEAINISSIVENKFNIIFIILLSLLWVYLSGIGSFAYQSHDHVWRNAIFRVLIERDWPVLLNYDGNVYTHVYYFAFWLPAALFGKITNLEIGEFFLYFWSVIGIFLTFLLISSKSKQKIVYILPLFVLFSGLDIVESFILHNSPDFLWFSSEHLEWTCWPFQFSSFTTLLFWVYNQGIPAWLFTLILLYQKDNKSIIFLYSLSFLLCTLPAIGMLPIICFITLNNCKKMPSFNQKMTSDLVIFIKSLVSIQNFVGLIITLISYSFLSVNKMGQSGFSILNLSQHLMTYLLFMFFEALIYYFLIYKHNKNNGLYWCSLITLLIVPWISLGNAFEICMRSSIPSLVVLFVLIIETIDFYIENNEKKLLIALLVVLGLGMINPCHEITRSVSMTILKNREGVPVRIEDDIVNNIPKHRNFFGLIKDTFFFKYLSK